MKTVMKLVGYINPLGDRPSFILPLFYGNDHLYTQALHDDSIVGFNECSVTESGFKVTNTNICKHAGETALYGFWFSNDEIHFGDKAEIALLLKIKIFPIADYPFLCLEIYDFLEDIENREISIAMCRNILSAINSEIADNWYNSMVIAPANPIISKRGITATHPANRTAIIGQHCRKRSGSGRLVKARVASTNPVTILPISEKTKKMLARAGISTIGELVNTEVRKLRAAGGRPETILELEKALKSLGIKKKWIERVGIKSKTTEYA